MSVARTTIVALAWLLRAARNRLIDVMRRRDLDERKLRLRGASDEATNEVVAAIPVEGQPNGAIATDDAVWFSDKVGGTVSRIDPVTSEVVATIPLGKRRLG